MIRPGDPVLVHGYFGCVTDVGGEVVGIKLCERGGMPGRLYTTIPKVAQAMADEWTRVWIARKEEKDGTE